MKSIILVRRAYGLGGAEIYNLNLAAELKEHGYNPIICTQQKEFALLAKSSGYKVINPLWLNNQGVHSGKWSYKTWIKYAITSPIILVQYLYYLLRFNVEAMIIQTRDDQILGTLASFLLGRRSIWLDHGDFKHVLKIEDKQFQRIYRHSISKAYALVCVAYYERDLVLKLLPGSLKNKVITIHNGVSKKKFERPYKSPSDMLIFGSTARVQHQKGIDILVEAFAKALPKLPSNSILRLGGYVDDQKIIEAAKKLNISNKIEFIGGLKLDEVAGFLESIDIFVFPSRGEVFPLSVLEAIMARKPIIASDVGGIPEVIKNRENGLLVKAGNVSELAEALIELSNPKLRKKYAISAFENYSQAFDFSNIVKREMMPLIKGKIDAKRF